MVDVFTFITKQLHSYHLNDPDCKASDDPVSTSVVTYPQLKTMLSNRDVQLLDVREPHEYQEGRIADAVNMPRKIYPSCKNCSSLFFFFWQILSHLSLCWWIAVSVVDESLRLSPEQFQQRYHVTAPGEDDHNIVFYCRSGNRSLKALSTAQQLGFHR